MSNLKEIAYSIMVISPTRDFVSFSSQILARHSFTPIKWVQSVTEARHALSLRSFDCVVINYPLKDESGITLAMELSRETTTAVLLLVPSIPYSEIEAKTRGSGIFLLKKPFSIQTLSLVFPWLSSSIDRIRDLGKTKVKLEERMDEIKLVSRAKMVLMETLSMNEEDAHKYIQREAMDRCLSKREVAKNILDTWSR